MEGSIPLNAQTFRIEIWQKEADRNPLLNKWVQIAHRLGINHLTDSFEVRVFFVKGAVTEDTVDKLARRVLADPVTETYAISSVDAFTCDVPHDHSIEVTLLAGVTDSAAENLLRVVSQPEYAGIEAVATGTRYLLTGALEPSDLERLAVRVFSNAIIQRCQIDSPAQPGFVQDQVADDRVEFIDLREADDDELLDISQQRRLALNLDEMHAIQGYFRQAGREPTDVEIEMLAQTWSEHCVHKTFKATIEYDGPLPGTDAASAPTRQQIDGLLNTYIRAATDKLNKDWVYSAFVDNAGIIRFDDQYDLAFKVETHNHPSAVEPFGGSNTGVGGVVRDVLGVSARPIANTDVLCFGMADVPGDQLPDGVIHPAIIADEVVHGVEDYGNKMGIPTVNGAVLYHDSYTANPLVFCGCLGLLPHGSHPTEPQAGDLIVVIGGRTGRDGLRGATFSSMEMDGMTGQIAGSSVQIGHPIHEKQVQEVIERARERGLYSAITDCGAGGLSSAVGEMGAAIGAQVQLETVPLKYTGLQPWEIWLSEAQERMVLAVPPANWDALKTICDGQDVEAVRIGSFESGGRLTLKYGERVVSDVAMDFLHDGLPRRVMQATWSPPDSSTVAPDHTPDLRATLLKLLAHPNIRSKETIVRQYDHEVQGGTVVKPLVGAMEQGHGDAAALIPLATKHTASRGVALSNGICPQYGELDPYAMAWAAIDEALRNLVAIGADPDQVAILDNFCWGNPQLPDRLGSLVRCAQGCHDAALAYGTPFVSGKDSLNNEYRDASGQQHAIPGTLLISAVGIVPDVNQTVTMDLKAAGNLLYIVGQTRDEMGGSHYHLVNDMQGGSVPQPNPDALTTLRQLHQAIQQGQVQACHDISEGGLAVALAEMSIAGGLGADVYLDSVSVTSPVIALFAESTSRFIIEVQPDQATAIEKLLDAQPIGQVVAADHVTFQHQSGLSLDYSLAELNSAWRGETQPAVVDQPPTNSNPRSHNRNRQTGANARPRVLILHANGSNRDHEAALACEQAGGAPEIVHINQLVNQERAMLDYHMLVVPGGFSYGDDLGAGVLWAQDFKHGLYDDLRRFVESGRPTLGICNGFQALVKAGLLPGESFSTKPAVTLTYNKFGKFECRWVYLKPNPHSPCLFTDSLSDLIYCPVAHGEGRLAVLDDDTLAALWADGLATLTYVDQAGDPTSYPGNPNGSVAGIASICNPAGNVMGLMPHPEDHIFGWQHPRRHRGESGLYGLSLFKNGIKFA